MARLLRSALWLLLTAVLVWVAVVAYWKIAGIRPDERDLVLYLAVLPLAAFSVLALLRLGLKNAGSKASDRQARDSAAAPGPSTEDGAPATRPAIPLAILAGAVQLPAGGDAASVLGAIADPPAPELHPRLKDGSGFPVFASWVDEVDTDAALQALEAAGVTDTEIRRLDEEQLRGIGLMLPVTQDLLDRVAAEGWLAPAATDAAKLHATILLPSQWPAALRGPVAAWFAEEARAAGLDAGKLTVDVLPATAGDEVWRCLSSLATPASTPPPVPVLHLVLACHSQVGERSVQRLDQAGQLLSAMRSEGVVPGEGAAGVLLHAPDASGAFAFPPAAVLRAQASEHQGVSWQARTAIGQMQALFEQVRARAGNPADGDVAAVLSDADLRKSRAMALAGFLGQALGHLETEDACLSTGRSCGHVGIVSPLALLALATASVAAGKQAVLAAALAEADQRALALVTSPAPAAADDAAASPSKPQAT